MFLFVLQIDIITSGDHVNELYILVAGMAVGMRAGAGGDGMVARHADSEDVVIDKDNFSVHGPAAAPHSQALGPGDTAGEMAFFTETPCMEVRTGLVLAGAVCVDKRGRGSCPFVWRGTTAIGIALSTAFILTAILTSPPLFYSPAHRLCARWACAVSWWFPALCTMPCLQTFRSARPPSWTTWWHVHRRCDVVQAADAACGMQLCHAAIARCCRCLLDLSSLHQKVCCHIVMSHML
jgi:hypothetical protein